jgi:hypothetical protein
MFFSALCSRSNHAAMSVSSAVSGNTPSTENIASTPLPLVSTTSSAM